MSLARLELRLLSCPPPAATKLAARFELTSGRLISAEPSFLCLGDVREAELAASLTWKVIFRGKGCVYIHSDTQAAAKRSAKLVAQMVSRLRNSSASGPLEANVLFVTRLGRPQVRSTRHSPTWGLDNSCHPRISR